MKLLTISNHKTTKGESLGFLTGILYLAPANLSGRNVCPFSTAGCRAACLNTAGRGAFNSVQTARLKKTKWFINDRKSFIDQLHKDITALRRKAKRMGLKPVVRLNGTSDMLWEKIAPSLFRENPNIQFYDYTKYPPRTRQDIPANYHLTFSRSELTEVSKIDTSIFKKRNVAVVFEKTLPKFYLGYQVVNGDETDLRFLDVQGVIVGLTAKGRARHDTSGFVVRGAQ